MTINSLAFRLFATAVAWTLVVLPAAGFLIYSMYSRDIVSTHDRRIKLLLTVISLDSDNRGGGEPGEPKNVGDPLFTVKQSGWYWQIKPLDNKAGRRVVSENLAQPAGEDYPLPSELGIPPGDDEMRWGIITNGLGQRLRVAEVLHIFGEGADAQRYSISVAGTLAEVDKSLASFRTRLVQSLSLAGVGLFFVTLFQVRVSLHPLKQVEQRWRRSASRHSTKLEGRPARRDRAAAGRA